MATPALVHASQHVLGSGDEEGTWLLEVERAASDGDPLLMCTFTAIPWFFQTWLHTLEVAIDSSRMPIQQVRSDAAAALTHVRTHSVQLCRQFSSQCQQDNVVAVVEQN